MNVVLSVLGGLAGVYSILIFIRIILSWFQGPAYGRPVELLRGITDPYLNFFRRFNLRLANFDLSPVVALGFLSIVQNILGILARGGRITAGFILALVLGIAWSVVSFILGFCLVLLALRAVAYFTNRNIYSPFWSIIDNLAKPVQYRISRTVFGRRIVRYSTELAVSGAVLLALRIGLGFLVKFCTGFLYGLPF